MPEVVALTDDVALADDVVLEEPEGEAVADVEELAEPVGEGENDALDDAVPLTVAVGVGVAGTTSPATSLADSARL